MYYYFIHGYQFEWDLDLHDTFIKQIKHQSDSLTEFLASYSENKCKDQIIVVFEDKTVWRLI